MPGGGGARLRSRRRLAKLGSPRRGKADQATAVVEAKTIEAVVTVLRGIAMRKAAVRQFDCPQAGLI